MTTDEEVGKSRYEEKQIVDHISAISRAAATLGLIRVTYLGVPNEELTSASFPLFNDTGRRTYQFQSHSTTVDRFFKMPIKPIEGVSLATSSPP